MEFDVVQLTQQALWLVLLLSGPPILVAVVAGLVIAFLQAVTQIQEQTISYAIKLVAIILTLFVTANLIGGTLHNFGDRIFSDFPSMVTS